MATRTGISSLVLAALLLAAGGCSSPQGQTDVATLDGQRITETSDSSAKRFQDTPLKGRTAVESAIELSEKYARLSDQTVSLREENQRLLVENQSLKQEVASLDARLKQTQKELSEANDLLIEMLTELNNWKNNILGFRGEMRQAAQAQLEALLKVLELLGGEVEAGKLADKSAATLNPGQDQGTEPNAPAVPSAGDANETQ
jgi:predicted nuclease with TOPRIM domain